MRKSPSARLLLAAVACAAAVAILASCSGASPRPARQPGAAHPASAAAPARLSLPAPTGPYPVGTVSLHLIDRSRRNPFAAFPPYRELMASVWYPARNAASYPLAPYMLPGAASHFGSPRGQAQQLLGLPPGAVGWAMIRTSGHEDAPVARAGRPFSVVLFSPDLEDPRTLDTTPVQDLASRGYVVVTIDHTYESSEVEFPGGRMVDSQLPALFGQVQRTHEHLSASLQHVLAWVKKDIAARVGDVRFVLDELSAINAGRNPDAGQQPLPPGLAGALDLARIGVFGESLGGMTGLQAMYEDPRIKAGVDLDGADVGPGPRNNTGNLIPALSHGISRPFMIMATPGSDINTVPAWKPFWRNSTGWHLDLTLLGATGDHSYSDAAPLLPQITRRLRLPHSLITSDIGTINPLTTIPAEEAYLCAFFDRWLRGHDNHLLDHPSPRYPEFTFVR